MDAFGARGKMKKKYEILDGLPGYGPMYIPITETGEAFFSEGFVVKFSKDTGEEWIANFRPGMTNFNVIYEIDNSSVLVIAGGSVYIINPNQEKPIKCFGGGEDFCQKIEDGRFVLADGISLTIIEKNLEHWHTEKISWDGIRNIKIENNTVYGESYTPINTEKEWITFEYNINKKELVGGS